MTINAQLETTVNKTQYRQMNSKQARDNWVAVFVCVFAGVVCALQIAKLSIAAPFLIIDLSLGHDSIGSLGSIFSLLGMLGGIPLATAALKTGLKRSLLLGILAICICSFIPTIFPQLWLLYVLRVIEGLGFILVAVAAPTLVQEQVKQSKKDIAMSFWSCFMPIGIAIMMFGGTLFSSWQSIWLANGITAFICLVLIWFLVPNPIQRKSRLNTRKIVALLILVIRAPTAVRIALIFTCYNLMYFAFYNFLPLLVVEKLQLEYVFAGVITGFAAISNIFGNLISGVVLSKGYTRQHIFTLSFIVMAAMGWLIFTQDIHPLLVTIAAILFTGIGGMLPAAVLSSAPIVAPVTAAIPITLGLYMQGSNLGQFIGPVVTGVGTELFGWGAAGPVFISLGVLGLVLVFVRAKVKLH